MKIVKYYSDGCAPCKQLKQVTTALKLEFDEEVNLSSEPQRAFSQGIKAVPTIVKYDDNGNEINRIIGLTSAACLREFFGKQPHPELNDELPF